MYLLKSIMYNKKQNKTRHTLFIKNDASCFEDLMRKYSCNNIQGNIKIFS